MVEGKLGKYSRSVSIIGIGATPFCCIDDDPELKGLTEGEFFGHAALMAMADAGLEPRDVDYLDVYKRQALLSAGPFLVVHNEDEYL